MANPFWPEVTDLESAKKACRTAAGAAFFIAGLTAIVAGIALAGTTVIPGISGWALVDAAIFLVLGIFLRRFSRTAAVIALVLFILERISMMTQDTSPASLPLGIFLTLMFITGVRGAFAYRRLSAATDTQARAAGGTIG
ncbi:MAG: hypothetical protein M3P27_09380 [Acidobacteriota bacterium]|nr:hypothetical protein [Acidobacteriota bacterium]